MAMDCIRTSRKRKWSRRRNDDCPTVERLRVGQSRPRVSGSQVNRLTCAVRCIDDLRSPTSPLRRPTMKHALTTLLTILLLLISSSAARADSPADEAGFKPILNGRDLTGWDGDPAHWLVKGGSVVGETTVENPIKTNTLLIWRQGELDDFELRCSYRLTSDWGNSGIQYRSKQMKEAGPWVVGGYQADIESGDTYTGILYEERMRGIVAQRGQRVTVDKDGKIIQGPPVGDSKEIQSAINKKEWNDYVVTAEGNHLIQKINGRVTCYVTDEQPSKAARSGIL